MVTVSLFPQTNNSYAAFLNPAKILSVDMSSWCKVNASEQYEIYAVISQIYENLSLVPLLLVVSLVKQVREGGSGVDGVVQRQEHTAGGEQKGCFGCHCVPLD